MVKRIVFVSLIAFIALQLTAQNNNRIRVHDPVAIQVNDSYYMFSTGHGIASWKSDDMLNWEFLTPVFKESPDWAKKEVPKFDGNIWAPDISYHNGKYYLYYSISSFASNRSAMGVATNVTLDSDDEDYKWLDHGKVVESVPGRDNWNAIDPNLVFDDDNEPWLSFGSFWGGLKMVKLSDDLLSIAKPQKWHAIASRQRDSGLDETDPGNAAIEAPFVFKKDKYYYLFVSFDLCCRGSRSTYNVRVGRSESATGPYVDKDGVPMLQGGGTLIVEGDENYYGIGHNSVYTFEGEDYMFSHGYDKADRGRSKLMIHRVLWDDEQWPYVEEIN
ncbi:MAG: arabinan endo-1,5-alpha-L-arabinosidase [Prolixibacteraceae bacterium]|jgi:arabinan endo-1,5-alpha-L-arabinosidase|nr:arabinan endo-1,5-alpha-L-arabinosidase [Prolixibacteraceae bacterium]